MIQMKTEENFLPSTYQQRIFDWVANETGNAVVTAVAGSGKSKTLQKLLTVFPSDRSVLFLAFNRDAADELREKLKNETDRLLRAGFAVCRWDCKTIHQLGNKTLASADMSGKPVSNKYMKLAQFYCSEIVDGAPRLDPNLYNPYNEARNLADLVDKVRLTLTNPCDKDALSQLCTRFEIEIDGTDPVVWKLAVEGVPALLERGKQAAKAEKVIDFTDMIYLPTVLRLTPYQYDWVCVDEAQDLSPAQRALVLSAKKKNGRFIAVGDRNQAIYGFAGASLRSIDEIIEDTHAIELPLSICYRCPRSVIEYANTIRPGTEWAEHAPTGHVVTIAEDRVSDVAQAGDLILCRLTAPLVEMCLELLRDGKRATVRGRDLGASFVALIEKLQKQFRAIAEPFFFLDLIKIAEEYQRQQVTILSAGNDDNEMKIAALQDKIETLIALYGAYQASVGESEATTAGFIAHIKAFFAPDPDAQIILSTGHRAKGLEFGRVFILREDQLPHPRAKTTEQITQEYNLWYVMITRAQETLYLVHTAASEQQQTEASTSLFVGGVSIDDMTPTEKTSESSLSDAGDDPAKTELVQPQQYTPAEAKPKHAGGRPSLGKHLYSLKLRPDIIEMVDTEITERKAEGRTDGIDRGELIEEMVREWFANL